MVVELEVEGWRLEQVGEGVEVQLVWVSCLVFLIASTL